MKPTVYKELIAEKYKEKQKEGNIGNEDEDKQRAKTDLKNMTNRCINTGCHLFRCDIDRG